MNSCVNIGADRIKTIMEENDIKTQKELAEIIGIDPNKIVQIKKNGFTRYYAELTNLKFPRYSIEWLLGESDYKNRYDERVKQLPQKMMMNQKMISDIIRDLGYFLFEVTKSDEEGEDRLECAILGNGNDPTKEGFKIIKMSGEEEYSSFCDSICTYIDFCLEKYFFDIEGPKNLTAKLENVSREAEELKFFVEKMRKEPEEERMKVFTWEKQQAEREPLDNEEKTCGKPDTIQDSLTRTESRSEKAFTARVKLK